MTIINAKSPDYCPYWSPGNNECLLTTGGMLIPTHEHLLAYCRARGYASCPHYVKHDASKRSASMNSRSKTHDRRRHPRFSHRIPAAISIINHHEKNNVAVDRRALTVDLALGGMRLESSTPLPVRMNVLFSLDLNTSRNCDSGSGEVRWCKQKSEGSAFVAGLEFKSFDAEQTLRNLLEKSS